MASASQSPPKVLLFDIGGVCVVSPFQSILDYELSQGIPPGWVNYSISKSAPNGFWHKLERGLIPMDAGFFAGFNKDLRDPERWTAFYRSQQAKDTSLPREIPPVPEVDGEWLFNDMMTVSQQTDPWMLPALERLRQSGKYIMAALSNTVIFPAGHALADPDENGVSRHPVRNMFDVFVSSAHVGLRKPDRAAFQYALDEVDRFARENASRRDADGALGWSRGVQPADVLFIDDIGENLKAGKAFGYRTLKVNLGRAFEAVDELEKITGLALAGSHPRIPVKPKYTKVKARI
ncbi:hypothetical protein MGG_07049 [Pyricularia oryzae 70-15]|uniref:Epoxide hydrolase 2 n=2 Tax=Pyricularia oryzae TaxID=318829 RepID=G4MZQ7_PYRO7|nr:uncharacterized protein MGG_07049 [Pyricularia oryzae 70-15]EHA55421.1 hypothetical protein MGG_07049 [Pyricularia oryzae 70-15]KAI7925487.1 hypothetical protein M9X92_003261 [Pyricularia oryzae]QBZ57122.1 hypothetical protein PoMZ_02044 [Pyricularia oryzae]